MAAPRPRLGPYYPDGGHIKKGFWGPVTSSIDWCEKNYTVSHHVAEFGNTITNLGFVILGSAYIHQLRYEIQICFQSCHRLAVLRVLNTMLIALKSASPHDSRSLRGQAGQTGGP